VDDGERAGVVKGTPVLVPESEYNKLMILKKFIDNYGELNRKQAQSIVRQVYEAGK